MASIDSSSMRVSARRRPLPSRRIQHIFLASFATASLLSSATAYTPFQHTRRRLSPSLLHSANPKNSRVEAMEPKTEISQEARKKAMKALKQTRKKVELDQHLLEMLSGDFLYPTIRSDGRPAMVPAAMTVETMKRYRENMVAAAQELENGNLEAAAAYVDGHASIQAQDDYETFDDDDDDDVNLAAASIIEKVAPVVQKKNKKKQRGRPRKDSKKTSNSPEEMTSSLIEGGNMKVNNKGSANKGVKGEIGEAVSPQKVKRRKRVKKDLPKKRERRADYDESSTTGIMETKPATRSSKQAINNLQKYYRTELLTAKEEYSLGMKVNFLVKSEQVHEGIALDLERVPSMEEWARACGFEDEDPEFEEKEEYNKLRPAGYESMFEKQDPNMFVGAGLLKDAGPGRGRGRVKKPPPTRMADFMDDTINKFRPRGTRKYQLVPINRGTPSKFVHMIELAKEAKQRMVSSNMRLVVSIAKKYGGVGVNVQDLVQEGSLGLSRAAEKFEPKRGFKFSTYASWWIQQAVFRAIAYHSRTIRLPTHVHNLMNRVRKVRRELRQELGRNPNNEEIAEQLDMSVYKYNKMMRLTRKSISLETPKYQSNPKNLGMESDDRLVDTIDSAMVDEDVNLEKKVDRSLFLEDIREMMKILEDDERRVLCARYGLEDGMTRTVTAIAAQMKQTKAWVRSKECRALRKLRRPWYEAKLREHQESLME